MSLTIRDLWIHHTEAISHTPSGPSLGQQAQSVEALRPRTSPQAITAASTASTKRKREPRPKLDNEKCARCRKDKVKCSPQPRSWPDKCERCSIKGFECSPGEVKRRAGRKVSPTSLNSPGPGPTRHDHQASAIRDQMGQQSAEPHVDDVQQTWDIADMTNLITYVQLLNHESSLLAEAISYLQKLNFQVNATATLFSYTFAESRELEMYVPHLMADVRKVLRDRRHSESLTITDQLLYENAHEAIGEVFAVPRNDPISEGSLSYLPIGLHARHLIRKLRLDIQQGGSCDFKPLYGLLSQLGHKWLSGWEARFGFVTYPESLSYGVHHCAAYSLVLREFLTEPLIHIWVRDYILHSWDQNSPFPITRFAELWNADSESVNFLTLTGGHVDSEGLPLLHVAVLCNKPRIVRALLQDSRNIKSQPAFSGYSAFHFAASIGSVDCYRELLRCKNGKAMEGEPAGYDYLPLHLAAKNGHKHMVDYILGLHSYNREYVNERNDMGETPFMQAAKYGKLDVVQFLLDYPGVDIAAVDRYGRTALYHAMENEDIFALILSKLPDGYVNALDEDGDTPLHWLSKQAGRKAMQTVLGLSCILPDKADGIGWTPLCDAVDSGNLEAVKVLGIRRDVDVTKLSTLRPIHSRHGSFIAYAKAMAENGNKWSQILDWLKIHCEELEADLADWEIGNEGTAQDARESGQNTEEE